MQRLFLTLFTLFIAFALPMQDAEAKRFGGGKSSGMQRDSYSKRQSEPPQRNAASPAQNNGTAANPAPASKRPGWLGPVAGLAAGLGLAALASHFGMGEAVSNMLMIALLVMAAILLFKWLAGRRAPPPTEMQYAGTGAGNPSPLPQAPAPFPAAVSGAASIPALDQAGDPASRFPPGFDAEGFVRQAKLNFIRLQAANDAGDLDDLREFTTPEMYAEIKLQFGERGSAQQRTEVDRLDAEVLECAEEPDRLVVSVRFHGLIREDAGAAAPFDEVWHLTKPVKGNRGWTVAGIEQAA